MNRTISFLLVLMFFPLTTMAVGHAERIYNSTTRTFGVRTDAGEMTIAEYDDWLYYFHPTAYYSDTIMAYWMKRHIGVYPSSNTENYREFTFATRTIPWGKYTLRAWVIIDDKGEECSRWSFAGGRGWRAGAWSMQASSCDNQYMDIAYGWGGDTSGYIYGRVDKNGKVYIWELDKNGNDIYRPWDWSVVDKKYNY